MIHETTIRQLVEDAWSGDEYGWTCTCGDSSASHDDWLSAEASAENHEEHSHEP